MPDGLRPASAIAALVGLATLAGAPAAWAAEYRVDTLTDATDVLYDEEANRFGA